MRSRLEFSRRTPHLELVPDPDKEPKKFLLFSLKNELKAHTDTTLVMADFTDDILDIIEASHCKIVQAVITLDYVKKIVETQGGNTVVLFRHFIAQQNSLKSA